MSDRFTEARLDRLKDQDNTHTSPGDALELARQHLETEGSDELLMVLIQRKEGGVAIFTAGTTMAQSIFMLELAKVTLFSRSGEDA